MGVVLSQGTDYLVVEGIHLRTRKSHVLKLLSKSASPATPAPAARAEPRACGRALEEALLEVYEGPKHVCLVLDYGAHELDARNHLSSSVLQALRLLHELIPEASSWLSGGGAAAAGGPSLMLDRASIELLMARVPAIECHLQSESDLFDSFEI